MEMEGTLPPCSEGSGPPGAEKTRKDFPHGRLRGSVALPHVVPVLQNPRNPEFGLAATSASVFTLPGWEYPAVAALGS